MSIVKWNYTSENGIEIYGWTGINAKLTLGHIAAKCTRKELILKEYPPTNPTLMIIDAA